jgi:hypothetical protein
LPSRYRTNKPAHRKQSTPTSAPSTPSARK